VGRQTFEALLALRMHAACLARRMRAARARARFAASDGGAAERARAPRVHATGAARPSECTTGVRATRFSISHLR